jgi:hypothetical protein
VRIGIERALSISSVVRRHARMFPALKGDLSCTEE